MKTLEMIVPCFNEEESVDAFYKRISEVFSALNGMECGLIFVDDGSRDGTLKKIKALAEADGRVKYISFSRNFGKEGAMLAGLSYSTADFVGIIDADLQHDPSLIPDMLSALTEEGFDVAAAKRSDRRGEGALKRFLSAGFYKLSNAVTDIEIDEGAQDFRIMKRKVVNAVLSLSERERFSKGIFSFVGFKTKWFEHENAERVAGKSKWSLRKLTAYAINGIMSFSDAPLRIPTVLGWFFVIAAIIYGIFLFCDIPGVRSTPTRRIMDIVMLMGGFLMICFGIVGRYIAKIFTEVKGRPQFIVSETNIEKENRVEK